MTDGLTKEEDNLIRHYTSSINRVLAAMNEQEFTSEFNASMEELLGNPEHGQLQRGYKRSGREVNHVERYCNRGPSTNQD